jgi:FixJ family two-component response regulator
MLGDTICILDDDPSVLRSLKELLASDDFEAETFDDPEKVLEYIRAHVVRLAVLDVWMPTQSGIELQERLHHLSPETRVTIITGREEPTIRALALEGSAHERGNIPLTEYFPFRQTTPLCA